MSDTLEASPLNDAEIRRALIQRLSTRNIKPRAVMEELRVHNGNAIADVVTLHTEAHCYEIKGSEDKIERVVVQGRFYNTAFRRITLVTTERKLRGAMKFSPGFWGIMIALRDHNAVRFRHVRKARLNPQFDRESAAMTLWKSEMLDLLQERDFRRKPRTVLAQLIAQTRRNFEVSSSICDALLGRHQSLRP
jgi:hypothetical protein